MKTAAVQMNVVFGKKEDNYRKAGYFIEEASLSGCDTVLLPELWSTGYFPTSDIEKEADEDGMETKAFLSSLALKYNLNIVGGSVLTRKNGKYYNTGYIVSRFGHIEDEYDKTHLFTPLGEDKWITKGKSRSLFSLDGITSALILCYELRFPELTRRLVLDGAEVLFVSAAWPRERASSLFTLARARAIENEIYVVLSSSLGKSPLLEGAGESLIFSPDGEILASAGNEEACISAVLDTAVLGRIRSSIPVFPDRREELY